jgi:SNF2 family DNA or RNA helicase
MILLKENGGAFFAECTSTHSEEERTFYQLIQKYVYNFDVNRCQWQIPEACYHELQEWLQKIPKPGSSLKLPLFPYQEDIVSFCLNKGRALIAAVCGLGKTPCLIAIYSDAVKQKKITGPGLIVVKASLKVQWKKEIEKFTDLRAVILDTEKACTSGISSKIKRLKKKQDELLLKTETPSVIQELEVLNDQIENLEKQASDQFKSQFDNADLYIANYETLNDSAVRKELHHRKIQYMACDEIQYIKNDRATRSKSVCEFSDVKMRFGASATPIQKNPLDAFSIMKFIEPSLFPKKGQFEQRYIRYSGFSIISGSKNEEELNNKLSNFMIVKTHEDADSCLPSVVPITRYCEMDPKQIRMTEQLLEEIKALKEEEQEILKKYTNPELGKQNERVKVIDANIVARQTFAQELADSELLLESSESEMAHNYITGAKSTKLEMLIDLLEEILATGEKVCIFSKYKRMQEILTMRIQEEAKRNADFNTGIAYINGSLSAEQRYEESHTKFQDSNDYQILVMSDAGAEGISLGKAKYLIEYEPAESYSIQTQRRGRIERADSVHDTVFVYQLIAEKSYDEIALKVIAKKEKYDATIIKGIS